jgi:hypothetical protein
VVVEVPWASLQGDSPSGEGTAPASLPDGTTMSRVTLDEILCDAELVPVLTDRLGNPLDVGRTQRLFTPRQRQALAHRDKGCSYPRCGAPSEWSHAHHLVPYSEGGRTDLSNGALLCGRHHRHVHAAGLVGRVERGQVVWDTGPPGGPPYRTFTAARRLLDNALRQWRMPRMT